MDRQGKNSVNTPRSRASENRQGGSGGSKSSGAVKSAQASTASQVGKILDK